jgi:hypothetical protein
MGHGNVIEKTFLGEERGVPDIVPFGGPFGTVPELLFEKKGLIPSIQQLFVSLPKNIGIEVP